MQYCFSEKAESKSTCRPFMVLVQRIIEIFAFCHNGRPSLPFYMLLYMNVCVYVPVGVFVSILYVSACFGAFLQSSPGCFCSFWKQSEELWKETLVACADLMDYRQSLLEPGQTNCILGDVVGGAAAGSDLWHSNYSEMLHGYGGSDREVKLWIYSCSPAGHSDGTVLV